MSDPEPTADTGPTTGDGPPADRAPAARGEDDVASALALFYAIFKKDLLLLARYPVDTVSRFVFTIILFVLMFVGGTLVGGQAFDDSLAGLIVGYFLWSMAVSAYQGIAQNVQSEASWGTLEQLYMSPHGFGTVMVMKVTSNVFTSFLWGGITLLAMLLMTGRSLTVDVVTIVPIALLTLAGAVGLGFVMGGLALLYKRITAVVNMLQFGLIALISAPAFDQPGLRYLPLAQGSGMLQRAMTEGVRLWEFPVGDYLVLVATAVGYFLAGYLVFRRLAERARRLGVMGEY